MKDQEHLLESLKLKVKDSSMGESILKVLEALNDLETAAYQSGYAAGFNDGFDEGYDEGYNIGMRVRA